MKKLTDREMSVLRLLAEGKASKEIAVITNTSDNAAKAITRKVVRKLVGLNGSRTGAVAQAVKLGIIDLTSEAEHILADYHEADCLWEPVPGSAGRYRCNVHGHNGRNMIRHAIIRGTSYGPGMIVPYTTPHPDGDDLPEPTVQPRNSPSQPVEEVLNDYHGERT